MNEFEGEELEGKSNENVSNGGIGNRKSAGAGAENPARRSCQSPPKTTPGATARSKRGFFPSGFPIHVGDFNPPHPFALDRKSVV